MIRPATVDDAAALGALSFAATQAGYAEFVDDLRGRPNVAERVADWRRHLSAEGAGWTWVAVDEDVLVGLVTGTDAHLEELMVLPDRFGQGVGSELLQHFEEAARANGSTDLTLWTYAENTRAREFYEARGWRLDGDGDDGRHGPQVQFRKVLAA